ncbi:V-type proton ATPase subunit a [Elysia marginata]|uniref:V-type proton ATPase subunit a n=1 Tax=Elysia marginata TaxID=1093978 RepID=A0AAV4GXB2_9GAST|nr:V-type proton ATPase subunit a [Elysia marginata]
MGSLFRSEEMQLCQLLLQTEATYACVSELGELGLVQFKDLNSSVNAFQRKFVNEVRRCEEMERKLRYIEKEILKEGLRIYDVTDNPKAPAPKEMNDLELEFEKMDSELRQVNTNNEALKQNYLELTELKEVLGGAQSYFAMYGNNIQHLVEEETSHEEAIIGMKSQQGNLGYYVGTLLREKVPVFERVLRFVTHGTVFVHVEEISRTFQDPITGDEMHKCMFVVFFQGEQLRNKVKKVNEGLRGTIYPVPDTPAERNEMLVGVSTRLDDLENVLAQSNDHRLRVLGNAQKEMRAWTIKVEKIKAIYHTMNMFKVHQSSLIAECWFPVKALDDIRRALTVGEKQSGSSIPSVIQRMDTHEAPPTYYSCNKFVKGFQNIVDSYGVATYGEVNPAPYTIITFPFLFAVMFGDAGHGLIMFLFGLYLCVKEKELAAKKINNEIFTTFFGGRYIILLMGLFSIYTGMIYNDVFSKSLNIFGTEWDLTGITIPELEAKEDIELHPTMTHRNKTAYFFGVDPIWQSATNKIQFMNSLKMKMAIILGVSQMLFGICLSVFNHLHFRHYFDILVEFVPELLFLGCLFGYLVALVFYKWLMFDAESCAPALLIHYINMFMFKYVGKPQPTKTDPHPCDPQYVFYSGQQTIQTLLFMLAILCVPVLLLGKPIYVVLKKRMSSRRQFAHLSHPTDPLLSNEVGPANGFNKKGLKEGLESQVNPAYQHDEADAGIGNGNRVDPPSTVMSLNSDEETEDDMAKHGASEAQSHGGGHDDLDTGEMFIHQAIHTIEFCLGCISHTASYLRLWALSLAHAQLSEVLWSMVLRLGLTMGGRYVGGPITFVIFFVWANLTVGILLLMEGLSAFLHTLRLHWVEFQSKFYKGEGYHFQPFSFDYIHEMQTLEEAT